MRKVHDAVYGHPAAQEALGKWNAYIYMSNILPQYEYMGKGNPPQSVADFKGKRLRALGGMGRAAELIGATPSTMPASETYTALQRGTVDAIGFPYSYTFAAYKLDEIADWVTTNMSLGTVNCPSVFNVEAWNSLPDQYKELLLSLKDGAYTAMEAAYQEKDVANEKKWREGGEIQMVQIPEDEMAGFREIARPAGLGRLGRGQPGRPSRAGAAGSRPVHRKGGNVAIVMGLAPLPAAGAGRPWMTECLPTNRPTAPVRHSPASSAPPTKGSSGSRAGST